MMMPGGPARMLNTETQKPTRVWPTLARFWSYFQPWWYAVVLTLLLIVVATVLQVATAPMIGQAVDCFLLPNPAACWYTRADPAASTEVRLAGLGGLVALLTLLFVGGSLLQGLAFYSMNWAGQRALRRIREDTFAQIHRLSLGFYARNEAGNIMSRITSDTDTIQQVLGFALLSVVSGVLQLVLTGAAMLQANVPYALLSLSVVPLMAWATVYFSGQARRAFRASRREMGSVNAGLQESIAGVREVQAFNREDESIEQFRRTNAANRDANIRAASFTSALNPVLEALGYVAIAIVVVAGGLSALRNQPLLGTSVISLGTVFAFIQFVQRFNQPIQQIAVLWTNVQSAIAGGERIFGLLDERPEIVDRPDARPLPPIQGRVAFEDVTAAYTPGQPVLRGVSFVAEPGQTVAIVGPTGAGKTTIINLIPRFYDVTGGRVTIDGHDVREVTAASLRSQIGIVLQDSFLFADTVMNNIRYGRLEASDEEVIAAARLASAHSFIERLPEGYQTVLGERGSGLSQGQRQLIAIARAALANPRILILDEATSSVDTRTERLIQAAFDQLLEGRTSFVIAHRLSTIRNADQVLMVKDGQIVERGTHDALLARRGAYYELYMSQFRREEPAPAHETPA
ncbi:MAG: ABC transporter ATP-binding protein [Chloroflexi bacterium OHK40]